MIDAEFGQRFSRLMENTGITYTSLTELAGLSKNNVGNYKNGQIPNATMLYRMSQVFGVSMEYLLTGKEAADLSPDEQQLVSHYRAADDRGKRAIMRTAESESSELGSSTSQIG